MGTEIYIISYSKVCAQTVSQQTRHIIWQQQIRQPHVTCILSTDTMLKINIAISVLESWFCVYSTSWMSAPMKHTIKVVLLHLKKELCTRTDARLLENTKSDGLVNHLPVLHSVHHDTICTIIALFYSSLCSHRLCRLYFSFHTLRGQYQTACHFWPWDRSKLYVKVIVPLHTFLYSLFVMYVSLFLRIALILCNFCQHCKVLLVCQGCHVSVTK